MGIIEYLMQKIILFIWKKRVGKLFDGYISYLKTKNDPSKEIEQCKELFSLFENICADVFNTVKNISVNDIQEKLTYMTIVDPDLTYGYIVEVIDDFPPGVSLLKKMDERKKNKTARKHNRTMNELMDWFCLYIDLFNLSKYYDSRIFLPAY